MCVCKGVWEGEGGGGPHMCMNVGAQQRSVGEDGWVCTCVGLRVRAFVGSWLCVCVRECVCVCVWSSGMPQNI